MFAPFLILALSATAPGFDALKKKASEVESLQKTVSALLGDCSGADFEEAISCDENLKRASKRLRKGTHSIWIGPGDQQLVRLEGKRGKKHRLIVTPMFDAGSGHALTIGKPLRLDKRSGTPVVKVLVVDGMLADGVFEGDLKRALRLGMLSIEIVGRFDKTWRFKSKKSKTGVVEGVSFKATAIRFANARNGKVLLDATLK